MNDNRKAVVYVRVSSKEQEDEGFSIPAQIKLLHDYAVRHGFEIVREFRDVETAKIAGRAQFQEMVAFLRKSRDARVVLVEKTDRLYRNFRDYVTLEELDLEIHLVKENEVLSRDSRSHAKLVHAIKVVLAKNYIDNLSEETRKGMREKAEQGIWPSFAPLGYLNVEGPDGKKTIEPDPVVAPIVSRMFEWFAAGNYSIKDISKMAKAEGMVFRKSKLPVPKSIVHKILRTRLYTGEFDWGGKTYRGVHKPLVSRSMWEKVQSILDRRYARGTGKVKHTFPFSGLISCGHCGCSLVGEIKKGRYVYYHCTGYKGKCPEPYVRQEILEERFGDVIKMIAIDQETLAWVTDALRQSHVDEKRFHDEAIARLQAEYARLQNRIDAMYVDKLDGRIDADFFDRKAGEWRAEQARVKGNLDEHEEANQNYLNEGIRLLELASRAYALYAKQDGFEKRRLLNFVLSNSSWKGGELTPKFRQPFDLLAVTIAEGREEVTAGAVKTAPFEKWLPGQDSNLEPCGYERPDLSAGLGLSHHPHGVSGASGPPHRGGTYGLPA